MAFSKQYLEYVMDQMQTIGRIEQRRLFGGMGFYFEEIFFGFIDDDTLFFKVDDQTRGRYESAGMKGFDPYHDGRTSAGYYTVPAKVLEDSDDLQIWAMEAIDAARRKASSKKAPKKKARTTKKASAR